MFFEKFRGRKTPTIPLTPPIVEPDVEEAEPDLSPLQQDTLPPGQMFFEPFENVEVLVASPDHENNLILGFTAPLRVEVGDGSWRVEGKPSTNSMPVVRLNQRSASHLIYRLQEYVRKQ